MANNLGPTDFERLPDALIFEAVVEAGSMRGAARALGLSPSTVSTRLAALEEALGVRLLHRTTRRFSLTDAGRTLLDEISPILPRWRAAQNRVRAHASEPQGVLVVTAPDVIMSSHVIPAACAVRRRYPAMRFVFKTTVETLSLIDEAIDVAVRAGPLPPSEHGARELWRGAHVAVASPALLAARHVSDPAAFVETPALELTGRRRLRTWRNDVGETCTHRPQVVMEADNVDVYLSMIESAAGIGFLPELLARPGIQAGTFLRILPAWTADVVSFHVVTPSARRHGAAVTCFVAELMARFPNDGETRG